MAQMVLHSVKGVTNVCKNEQYSCLHRQFEQMLERFGDL